MYVRALSLSSRSFYRCFHERTSTYPTAIVPVPWGVPVQVSLIAVLGHGSGSHLFESVSSRQKKHSLYKDELEEPSARIGSTDFSKNDSTALFTFTVDQGHPFHRHQGHRIVTAVSGSGGASLRFSAATLEEIQSDSSLLITRMRNILIPPDALFTMRFDGRVWHQFAPQPGSKHPAFFAISAHTNESGGDLDPGLRDLVLSGKADIAALTELLPEKVQKELERAELQCSTIELSLESFPSKTQTIVCRLFRGTSGALRRTWTRWWGTTGWVLKSTAAQRAGKHLIVSEKSPSLYQKGLLSEQLKGLKIHHSDAFSLKFKLPKGAQPTADEVMCLILDGFLENRPPHVTRWMLLRNVMVRPLSLRTSPLGCPVSSLLGKLPDSRLFAGKFPVHASYSDPNGKSSQVVLGANDKHLQFRTEVSVALSEGEGEFVMRTNVHCLNMFGNLYMAVVDIPHKKIIAPAIMQHAMQYALVALQDPIAEPELSMSS